MKPIWIEYDMASTPFLDFFLNAPKGTKVNLGTSESRGGQELFGSNNEIESGLSTRRILNQIEDLEDSNLINSTQFQFDNVFVPLKNLGDSSVDISNALEQQIKIREEQRQADLGFSVELQNQLNEINQRLSGQVSDLGNAISDVSKGLDKENPAPFLPFNLPSFEQIKTPLLIGGLIVGGILGLKFLRK